MNTLSGIITLITDFGIRDGYVGAMKGVILGINPQADIVDISHGVDRHDLLQAALIESLPRLRSTDRTHVCGCIRLGLHRDRCRAG